MTQTRPRRLVEMIDGNNNDLCIIINNNNNNNSEYVSESTVRESPTNADAWTPGDGSLGGGERSDRVRGRRSKRVPISTGCNDLQNEFGKEDRHARKMEGRHARFKPTKTRGRFEDYSEILGRLPTKEEMRYSRDELLKSGNVERNPGPSSPVAVVGGVPEKKPLKIRRRNQKANASQVIANLVEAEAAAKSDAVLAAADNQKERIREEKRAEREAFLAAQAVSQRAQAENIFPKDVWFHPFEPGTGDWHTAAEREQDLPRHYLPYGVVHATLQEIVENPDERDAFSSETRLPAKPQLFKAIYDCTRYQKSPLGPVMETSHLGLVAIPLHVFLHARARGHYYHNFVSAVDCLVRLSAIRTDFVRRIDSMADNTLYIQVLAALLIGPNRKLANNFGWRDLVGMAQNTALGFDKLRNALPDVEGVYIHGYQSKFEDILPESVFDNIAQGRIRAKDYFDTALKGGQSLFINGMERIKESREHAREVDDYCRYLPFSIRDLIPVFPDPNDVKNQIVGLTKRVLSATNPTMAQRVRERIIARRIADMVEQKYALISPTDIMRAAHVWAQASALSYADQMVFINGVEWAVNGTGTDGFPTDFGAFVKAETYQQGKPVRFIIAPSPYYRGVMFGLLYAATENFVHIFSDHLNKHFTPAELMNAIADPRSELYIDTPSITSDFSSFESQIDSDRIDSNEAEVYVAASPPYMARRVQDFFMHMSQQSYNIQSKDFTAVIAPMRLSGTYHTSIGNCIQNMCITAALIAAHYGIPNEELADWFSSEFVTGKFRVEGDDGKFSVRSTFDKVSFDQLCKTSGVKLESVEGVVSSFEHPYCGLEENADGTTYRDPINILAKLTTVFRSASTRAHDHMLQFSKALAYATNYYAVPLVAGIATELVIAGRKLLIRRYGNKENLVGALRNFKSITPFTMFVRDAEIHKSIDFSLLDLTDDELRARVNVSPDARQKLSDRFSYFTVEAQKLIEERAIPAIHHAFETLSSFPDPAHVHSAFTDWYGKITQGWRTAHPVIVEKMRSAREAVKSANIAEMVTKVSNKSLSVCDDINDAIDRLPFLRFLNFVSYLLALLVPYFAFAHWSLVVFLLPWFVLFILILALVLFAYLRYCLGIPLNVIKVLFRISSWLISFCIPMIIMARFTREFRRPRVVDRNTFRLIRVIRHFFRGPEPDIMVPPEPNHSNIDPLTEAIGEHAGGLTHPADAPRPTPAARVRGAFRTLGLFARRVPF